MLDEAVLEFRKRSEFQKLDPVPYFLAFFEESAVLHHFHGTETGGVADSHSLLKQFRRDHADLAGRSRRDKASEGPGKTDVADIVHADPEVCHHELDARRDRALGELDLPDIVLIKMHLERYG